MVINITGLASMKYFCEKCGKRIKKRQLPWCPLCNLKKYQFAKKVGRNNNNNKNMKINQIVAPETPDDSTSEPTPEEKPKEGGEKEEEKTETPTEKTE